MKVYSCPAEIQAPTFTTIGDYNAAVEKHQEALKKWLVKHGYTGKNTGRTCKFPVADGYAVYMLAEGSKSCLIHLPYGDGYQFPYVERLTKKDILENIQREEALRKIFSRSGQ